ncbi:MAG: hypothetical protein CVT66_01005 [Actinobacteria bacterium HGW-Actinobacteria-6]|nr:MAG: hypothetical protein CVT66_01005 [Actinobacteria bacterium HGW-Actinobacteria-6]
MNAVHIRTHGLEDDQCTATVEMVVDELEGVVAVVAVKSLGITSVLFYEETISTRSILRTIRSAGYDARLLRGDPVAAAS